jgi:hypothetical protein
MNSPGIRALVITTHAEGQSMWVAALPTNPWSCPHQRSIFCRGLSRHLRPDLGSKALHGLEQAINRHTGKIAAEVLHP